jgi:hypothetical protein
MADQNGICNIQLVKTQLVLALLSALLEGSISKLKKDNLTISPKQNMFRFFVVVVERI